MEKVYLHSLGLFTYVFQARTQAPLFHISVMCENV